MKRAIAFRVDADQKTGLGHLMRCLWLARRLREERRRKCAFIVRAERPAIRVLERHAFPIHRIPRRIPHSKEYRMMARWLKGVGALVYDLRVDRYEGHVRNFRMLHRRVRLVMFDDTDPSKRYATAVIESPIGLPSRNPGSYRGFPYVVIAPAFRAVRSRPVRRRVRTVAIAAGGSDPAGATEKTLRALEEIPMPLDVRVILGAGFRGSARIHRLAETSPHRVRIDCDVDDMAVALKDADLAFTSMGLTAFELAALGVPAILLNPSAFHDRMARRFARFGSTENLGMTRRVSRRAIVTIFRQLDSDPRRRRSMGRTGRKLIDGRGIERVAKIIEEAADHETG